MIGIGIGLAIGLSGIGLGLIGYSALQGMARQPETIGRLQTAMLIAFAFVELGIILAVFVVPGSAGAAERVGNGYSSSATNDRAAVGTAPVQ